jgi:uracil-DNA glycosylase
MLDKSKIASAIRLHLMTLYDEGVIGLKIDKLPLRVSSGTQFVEKVSPVDSDGGTAGLAKTRQIIGDCTRCRLHSTRKSIVFGIGNPEADLVFVGEGPGQEEDNQGEPFVGNAGMLLNRIIAAMGLTRESVYICNVVKCRPPENRNPQDDEIQCCVPFLDMQIAAIKPRIICALGNTAAGYLTGERIPMVSLRGRFYEFKGIPVRPTYHPAAVLRNSSYRRPVWEDAQEIMRFLGKQAPSS